MHPSAYDLEAHQAEEAWVASLWPRNAFEEFLVCFLLGGLAQAYSTENFGSLTNEQYEATEGFLDFYDPEEFLQAPYREEPVYDENISLMSF
jgi:hypothetical protein